MDEIFASWREAAATSPFAFLGGLLIGFWVGGRFVIRKHTDEGEDR